MSTMVKKGSVKLLVVACVLACLVGIFMPLTASAAGIGGLFEFIINDDFTVNGSADITVTEALFACSEYLGVSEDEAAKYLEFHVDDEAKCVQVYENDDLVEVVYKNANGELCGYANGFTVSFPAASMEGIITNVSVGVKGVFDMAAEAFLFLTSNDLCMFMIAVTFGGIAIAFVGRSFKTARK